MTLQVMLSRILTAGAIDKEKLEDAGDWENGGKDSGGSSFEERKGKKKSKEEGKGEGQRGGARRRARRRKGRRKREEGEEEEDVRYPENSLFDASCRMAARQMESMYERARDCGERENSR